MKKIINITEARQILSEKMGNLYNPYEAFLFNVVKKLNLPKNTKILDIGTGWGIMAITLALNGYCVHTGQPEDKGEGHDWQYNHDHDEAHKAHVENSSSKTEDSCYPQSEFKTLSQNLNEESIRFDDQTWESNAKAVGVKEQIKFQHLDLKHLNISDATYDAVFLYDTLHHVENKVNAVNECLRVVKPGGIICIFEMNEHGVQDCIDNWGFEPKIVNPRIYLQEKPVKITQMNGDYSDAFIITVGGIRK